MRLKRWFAIPPSGITDFFAKVGNFSRVNTNELCVDDVCVTRDKFAEVFGASQSAAADASSAGSEAPALPGPATVAGTVGTTSAAGESVQNDGTSSAQAANNGDPAGSGGHEEDDAEQEAHDPEPQPDEIAPPHVSPPLIEDAGDPATTPASGQPVPRSTSEAANDNPTVEPLPATGTE